MTKLSAELQEGEARNSILDTGATLLLEIYYTPCPSLELYSGSKLQLGQLLKLAILRTGRLTFLIQESASWPLIALVDIPYVNTQNDNQRQ